MCYIRGQRNCDTILMWQQTPTRQQQKPTIFYKKEEFNSKVNELTKTHLILSAIYFVTFINFTPGHTLYHVCHLILFLQGME